MSDLPILDQLRGDLDRAYRRHETKRRRLPRLAIVPALATAAAAALAVVVFQGSGPTTVEALADTAAEQPPAAPAGKFAYFGERDPNWSSEWWVAADGSGRLLQVQQLDGTERPVGRWRVTGRPRAGWREWTRDVRFGPGEFDAVHRRIAPTALRLDVTKLPTDPDALLADLRAKLDAARRDDDPENGFHWPYEPSQLLTVLEQYLDHPLATPAQRSAMLAVAAGIDGIDTDEDARDPEGRPATRVSYQRPLDHGGHERMELYFDRDSAALLASRVVVEEGGRPYAYGRTRAPLATVGSLGERP